MILKLFKYHCLVTSWTGLWSNPSHEEWFSPPSSLEEISFFSWSEREVALSSSWNEPYTTQECGFDVCRVTESHLFLWKRNCDFGIRQVELSWEDTWCPENLGDLTACVRVRRASRVLLRGWFWRASRLGGLVDSYIVREKRSILKTSCKFRIASLSRGSEVVSFRVFVVSISLVVVEG